MNTKTRSLLFFAVVIGSILLFHAFFRQLLDFLSGSEFASLTFMTPFLSAVLMLRQRSRIFSDVRTSAGGGAVVAIGILILLFLNHGIGLAHPGDAFSAGMFAVVLVWIGAFVLFYGIDSAIKASFPLLMLLFMIPIPETWLAKIIHVLQQGSGDGAAILFSLTGTPYHRDGLAFMLPRTTIEIAPQCSSIRSSLALLIGCLLAGHLLLRTVSRKFILVLVAIPMAMVKNAIRIVTLSLLAIHLDMGYLAGGDLHRKGGIVFFVLTLLLMYPVLWVLRRSEKAATN